MYYQNIFFAYLYQNRLDLFHDGGIHLLQQLKMQQVLGVFVDLLHFSTSFNCNLVFMTCDPVGKKVLPR